MDNDDEGINVDASKEGIDLTYDGSSCEEDDASVSSGSEGNRTRVENTGGCTDVVDEDVNLRTTSGQHANPPKSVPILGIGESSMDDVNNLAAMYESKLRELRKIQRVEQQLKDAKSRVQAVR